MSECKTWKSNVMRNKSFNAFLQLIITLINYKVLKKNKKQTNRQTSCQLMRQATYFNAFCYIFFPVHAQGSATVCSFPTLKNLQQQFRNSQAHETSVTPWYLKRLFACATSTFPPHRCPTASKDLKSSHKSRHCMQAHQVQFSNASGNKSTSFEKMKSLKAWYQYITATEFIFSRLEEQIEAERANTEVCINWSWWTTEATQQYCILYSMLPVQDRWRVM